MNGGPITPLFSGLNGPTDVALDAAGDVFVTDTGNNRVVELTAGGTQTTLPFSGLNTPWGVAVDGAGDVFVADALNNRVVELTGSGAQITLPFSALNTPAGVAVDRAGDVFVADNGNNRVVELTPSGTQRTLPFSGLNLPAGVAVDATASLSRGAWVCRERAEGRSWTSGDMAASRLSAREDRVLVGAESRTSVACSCTSCRRARRSSFDEVP